MEQSLHNGPAGTGLVEVTVRPPFSPPYRMASKGSWGGGAGGAVTDPGSPPS